MTYPAPKTPAVRRLLAVLSNGQRIYESQADADADADEREREANGGRIEVRQRTSRSPASRTLASKDSDHVLSDALLRIRGARRYEVLDKWSIPVEVRSAAEDALRDASAELGLEAGSRAIAWFSVALPKSVTTVIGPADVVGFMDTTPGAFSTLYIRTSTSVADVVETVAHELAHSAQAAAMGVVRDDWDRADREARAERYARAFQRTQASRRAQASQRPRWIAGAPPERI